MLSASGSYLIDRYSTPTLPRRIDIVDTKSLKTVNLLTAKDPYEGYEMPTIETGTIKADDGTTDLYYRLTKPADFDPNKSIRSSSTYTAARTHNSSPVAG